MKLGIVQGRLSSPIAGHQTTPDDWLREFALLKHLRLSHIEWTLDNAKFLSNPIFKKQKRKIRKKISSVCFDNVVDVSDLYKKEVFEKEIGLPATFLSSLGINRITLPLLDASAINRKEDADLMSNHLMYLLEKNKKLVVSIESDSELSFLLPLLHASSRIKYTYDTGNLTAANRSHTEYIEALSDKIDNVHLKDRLKNYGPSVHIGDTDFEEIFRLLVSVNYQGPFTLQMARDPKDLEVTTISSYIDNFRRLYARYF